MFSRYHLPGLMVVSSMLVAAPQVSAEQDVQFQRTNRVYRLNADGSHRKLIVDLPQYIYQRAPVISTDGQTIAFNGAMSKPKGTNESVIVAGIDGSNARVLIDGTHATLSPKGRRIAFQRFGENRGVWVMDTTGSGEDAICLDEEGRFPSWSPDGSKIFYCKNHDGANGVVVDLIEGTRHYIYNEKFPSPYGFIDLHPDWSPDGKQLLLRGYFRDNSSDLSIVDARGAEFGHKTILKGRLIGTAWTGDGRILISRYDPAHNRNLIWEMPAAGPYEPKVLPGLDTSLTYHEIAVTPDGKHMLACLTLAEPIKQHAKSESKPKKPDGKSQ